MQCQIDFLKIELLEVPLIFTAILMLRLIIGIEKNFFGQLIGTGISAILIALTCTPLLARINKTTQ